MTEILTYRVRANRDRWEVLRDGHDRPLADFRSKDEALVWAQSEAGKIGMGRVIVEGERGAIESERDYVDDAVRDELHLRQ